MEKDFGADLQNIKAVIFDVDGTLYDLKKMRSKMFWDLLKYFFLHPQKISELLMVYKFRRLREKNRALNVPNLEQAQYEWPASSLNVSAQAVKQAVEEWMHVRPLKYLAQCRFSGVSELFLILRQKGIKIAVVSDYPAEEKLKALNLQADAVFSSTDPAINKFKPDPAGFLLALESLGVNKEQTLVIGDRQECEGQAATAAGIPYLLVGSDPEGFYKTFYEKVANI